jgi:hypothetical protein
MVSLIQRWRVFILVLSLGAAAMACNLSNPVATPIAYSSPTPFPTVFVTVAPTNTAAPSATTAPINTARPQPQCTPRTDWFAYVVKAGDSISTLATRTTSTTAVLVAANCLANANQISVGQVLFLPRIPATPVPTATRTATLQAAPVTIGNLSIIPSGGQAINERTVQAGTTVTLLADGLSNASVVNFYANQMGQPFHMLGTAANPTNTAQLAWQVPNTPGQEFFLTAQAVGTRGGTVSTALVHVIIAGGIISPPSVGLLSLSPSDGPNDFDRTVKMNTQVTITVVDLAQTAKVEFYIQNRDGSIISLGTVASPSGNAQISWSVPAQPGQEMFVYAVAKNAANQPAQTKLVNLRISA